MRKLRRDQSSCTMLQEEMVPLLREALSWAEECGASVHRGKISLAAVRDIDNATRLNTLLCRHPKDKELLFKIPPPQVLVRHCQGRSRQRGDNQR